jgi:Ribosomal subunit 39S
MLASNRFFGSVKAKLGPSRTVAHARLVYGKCRPVPLALATRDPPDRIFDGARARRLISRTYLSLASVVFAHQDNIEAANCQLEAMRRIPRLRAPASALSTSSSSIRTPATCLLKAELSTTTTTRSLSNASVPRTQVWQTQLRTQRRCLSTPTSQPPAKGLGLAESEELVDELEIFDEEVATPEIETALVYPREIVPAPTLDEISDPTYEPAESGVGLEEVGGLADWWDDPDHWGSAKEYVGFGPQEKITDPAILEVLTRRAIIEALTLKHFGKRPPAAFTLTGGKETLLKVVRVKLIAGEDGTATLKNQAHWERAWSTIKNLKSSGEAPEPIASSPEITVEEARELVKSWGSEWKLASLQDPLVKFYVCRFRPFSTRSTDVFFWFKMLTCKQAAKRIQRLTGHVIPDAKLLLIQNAKALIAHLTKPPKAKKLAEELISKGVLQELPNVRLYPRRVTPLDKERMVGRWKIITRELKKRELPIVGTGPYAKSVERKWVMGKQA